MAFSMSNMSSAFGGNATAEDKEEIQEVTTDEVAFKSLQGDNKARIFAEPWPTDNPPPTYASVLSIASAYSLYAAASPTALVIGKTSDVRKCIYDENQTEDVRNCEPIHTVHHTRLSQVAFLSDESHLIVSEERSSEVLFYNTQKLATKQSEVALRLSTNAPVRVLAPNPDPTQARFLALVNADDQLLLVDLGIGNLVSGGQGPVLANGVTCVTWSNKGKQLVAGRRDGTSIILKPDGNTVGTIPKPLSVPSNCGVASISWVENDVFVIIWTPDQLPEDEQPVSEYYVVKTNKDRSTFGFHKIEPEPIFPTVFDRKVTPVHFHTARLRSYGNLEQLLVFSANVAPELKMLAKISQSKECPDDYVIVAFKDDRQLASLPFMSDGSTDSTPIGIAIDLSDDKNIVAPIMDDAEVHESDTPLPELAALTSEGILCMWAVVFADAIRSKVPYSGITELETKRRQITSKGSDDMHSTKTVNQNVNTNAAATSSATDAMQSTGMGGTQSIVSPSMTDTSKSVFTPPSAKSNFSSFGTGAGFGQTSSIGPGKTTSSWTTSGFGGTTQTQNSSSGFGQPAFGTTTAPPSGGSNPVFGQAGGFGGLGQTNSMSPAFGQSGFGSQPSKPAFGQTGFGAQSSQGGVFGTNTSSSSTFANTSKPSSGFGSFASHNGFGSVNKSDSPFAKTASSSGGLGQTANAGASPFGQASGSSAFGRPTTQNAFGTSSTVGAFGTPSTSSSFGQGSKSNFKLESTFTKDETSTEKDDDQGSISSLGFGAFGSMLAGPAKAQLSPSKEEEMGDDDGSVTEVEELKKPLITPPATINQSKTTTTPHVSSLFGTFQPQDKTPQSQRPLSTQWSFGGVPSTTPKDTPAPNKTIFVTKSTSQQSPAFVQKSEPLKASEPFGLNAVSKQTSEPVEEADDTDSEKASQEEVEEADVEPPLPPDPFSKPEYHVGDTSASSLNSTSREAEDAPLPPDFIPANKNAAQSLRTEDSELPTEILSSGFSGSGEDVTGDVSPVDDSEEDDEETESEHVDKPPVETSPESSFGHITDRSPQISHTGESVAQTKVEQPKTRLFGEQLPSGPIFPPPKPEATPESPSPQRKTARSIFMQSPARSSSAPVGPDFQRRKQESAALAAKAREEEVARERARVEAAKKAQQEAEARETRPLVDDEDEVLRQSLAQPPEPQEDLVPFMPKRRDDAFDTFDTGQNDIPSQIQRLYRSINDMVITLGINGRALSQFMLYQKNQEPVEDWPSVLASDTPSDAFNDERDLCDIDHLQAGHDLLDQMLTDLTINDILAKLDDCQNLLTGEVSDLKNRITALRRSTQQRLQSGDAINAPLSAEQSYIQQDLRKASAATFTKLSTVEDSLTILRAKIAEISPGSKDGDAGFLGFAKTSKKRPTVEAVMNTVQKMTNIAERKSADVDVLIAQLKQINLQTSQTAKHSQSRTLERQVRNQGSAKTPGSARSDAGSVYLTPSSDFSRSQAGSAKGTPAKGVRLSIEDRDRWREKARRKKDLAGLLKEIMAEKGKQAKAQ